MGTPSVDATRDMLVDVLTGVRKVSEQELREYCVDAVLLERAAQVFFTRSDYQIGWSPVEQLLDEGYLSAIPPEVADSCQVIQVHRSSVAPAGSWSDATVKRFHFSVFVTRSKKWIATLAPIPPGGGRCDKSSRQVGTFTTVADMVAWLEVRIELVESTSYLDFGRSHLMGVVRGLGIAMNSTHARRQALLEADAAALNRMRPLLIL